MGESEDDVEITDRQDFGLARLEPASRVEALALGAMPIAAGIVGGPFQPAVVASLQVAAEGRGPAPLNIPKDLEVGIGQRTGATALS